MKKHDFWKFLKTELSVFANELFICLFVCLCNSQVFDEQLDESVPDTSEADTATSNPLITIQESDKVRPLRGRQFKFITLDHFKDLPDVNVVFFTIAPSCIIFAELNPILVSFYFWGAGSKKIVHVFLYHITLSHGISFGIAFVWVKKSWIIP